MSDPSFSPDRDGLHSALDALIDPAINFDDASLATAFPETGVGEAKAIELLAPFVIGGARKLGADTAFAHMDPPTPWVTWATTLWNAALNQNLLHPDVAPVARDVEDRVIGWLAPLFGMAGGHMTPGSTVGNLTALWAARELKGVKQVVASRAAHVSVLKSAHILGLEFVAVETDAEGRIDRNQLPASLAKSALVLTAGTTSAGAIDDLGLANRAAWTHVDAAWAGPLRLSKAHRDKLQGIDAAESVAISAHKWLFQPKASGLVLFRDVAAAHDAISFGGAYLAAPNIGLLGSRGAVAVPLLATILSWGRAGLEARIDATMALSEKLFAFLTKAANVRLFGPNSTGVILWRAESGIDTRAIIESLPVGSASSAREAGSEWVRHVAANPNADIDRLTATIEQVLGA